MNLADLKADLKARVAQVEHLLYMPQTAHPLLEEARQLLVKNIQTHLSQVSSSVLSLGSNLLQQLEKAVTATPPTAPPTVLPSATPPTAPPTVLPSATPPTAPATSSPATK